MHFRIFLKFGLGLFLIMEGNWIIGVPCMQECSKLEAQMREQKLLCEALENRIANLQEVNKKVTADFNKYVNDLKKELMSDLKPLLKDIYNEFRDLMTSIGNPVWGNLSPHHNEYLKNIRNLLKAPDWKRLDGMKDLRELFFLIDKTTSIICTGKSFSDDFLPTKYIKIFAKYTNNMCRTKTLFKYGVKGVEIGLREYITFQDLKYLLKIKNDQQFAKELMNSRIQGLITELRGNYIQLHNLQRDVNICYQRQQKAQTEEEPKDYIGVPEELEGWEPTADVPTAPSVIARPGLMPDQLELISINMMEFFQDIIKESMRFLNLRQKLVDQKHLQELNSIINDLKNQLSYRIDWSQYIQTRGTEIYASMPKRPSFLEFLGPLLIQTAISNWNGFLDKQYRGRFANLTLSLICYDPKSGHYSMGSGSRGCSGGSVIYKVVNAADPNRWRDWVNLVSRGK